MASTVTKAITETAPPAAARETTTTAQTLHASRATSSGPRCGACFSLGPSSGTIRCEREAGHDLGWHRSDRHRFEWDQSALWPLPVDAFVTRAVHLGERHSNEPRGNEPDGGRAGREPHAA